MTLFQSIFMMLFALLLLFFPDSVFVFQGVIFGASAVSLYSFFRMVKDPDWVRFGNIACFSILFGYVVSTAVYTILDYFEYGNASYTQNVSNFGYSQATISYTVLSIFLVCIFLAACARFERPLPLSNHFYHVFSEKYFYLIMLSVCVIFLGFITEKIGYLGIYLISEKRISPFGALCFNAMPPLTAVSIALLLFLPPGLKKYRKVMIVTSSVLVFLTIPLGRRVFMYTIILTMFLIGPGLTEIFRNRKPNIIKTICAALITVFIFGWGFQTFFALRITVDKMAYHRKPGIVEIIPHAIEEFNDSYAVLELRYKLYENIIQRPFILSYLAGLVDAHQYKSTPLFGELQQALFMAVPSLFLPQKTLKEEFSPEEVTHPFLGILPFDGPNTMLTSGLNDLGFIGLLIYPVAIVGLYIFIRRMVPSNWPSFLHLYILLRLIYSLLYFEESLGALIGSGLRDTAIVVFIYWTILKIKARHFHLKGFD